MVIISILRSRILFSIILAFGFAPAMAQVKFTTVASSKEIGRGDYVQVEFVVENAQQIEHLTHASFQGFNIVQGPIQSSGMSVINGNMSQYKALSFVLQPVRAGRFTIPGATATIDGKPMRSNPVSIEVSAKGSSSAGNSSSNLRPIPKLAWPGETGDIDREYFLKPGENIAEKIKKNLFVTVDVSKTKCYVGESIVATYKLYSRVQSESRVTRHPSLNGFSVYDMVDPNNDAASVESINGRPFTVHVIRKAQLIPLQPGTVDLDPVEIENTVHFLKSATGQKKRGGNSIRDFFDDLADDNLQATPIDQHVTLESKPVAISVKALPEEKKPEDYNGAVGRFSIRANVENMHINAQEAAILKITVNGKGNLPMVNAPVVHWPSNIESYDATTKEVIDKTVAPLTGSKTFEYSFIPQKAGSYDIPAIQLSYFDPSSSTYRTVESQPLNVSVGAEKTSGKHSSPGQTALQTTEPGNNFLNFLTDHLEWFFAILILSGLAIYLWLQNRKLKAHQPAPAEPAITARVQTILVAPAPDPLRRAKHLLEEREYKTFYTELNRTLWHEVADKLDLPSSELNKHNIILKLQAQGWDNSKAMLLENIFSECEMKLYTPDYSSFDMQRILQHAEEIINYLHTV